MTSPEEPVLSLELHDRIGPLNPTGVTLPVNSTLTQAAEFVLTSPIVKAVVQTIDGSRTSQLMTNENASGSSDDLGVGAGADPKEKKEEKKPAWSELKTKAGKERKRLPLACIACRRKKIRCSGEKPACKHCLRSRTPCVYKVTTRKAAPRTDYMTMLDKRLKRMEERVIKIIPEPDPSKMASIGRASVKPPAVPAPRSVGSKKRGAEEAFGAEVEQWAENEAKADPPKRVGADQAENRLLTDGVEHLPPKELQEHLAETFFDNCYGQAYYLLHKPSFMRRLKAGTIPPVLILAVCAIAARFSTHPDVSTDPPFLRGEQWAKPAREIALKRYDEPSITILIVLVILCLHEFGTCQGGRSWMFGGIAIRMAASLQLHREIEHDPSGPKGSKAAELNITDREIRRRAMWSCFMMDRFISSGTERPMTLDEKDIQIQLPINESRFQMELPGLTEQLDGLVISSDPVDEEARESVKDNMGVAAYLVRTIALWGRVVRYLNLGGRKLDPHPMWHPESKYMELKKQAEELQASFPDRLKFNQENLRTHSAKAIGNQFLFFHISYQQIILFLHKFAVPTRPNAPPPKEMPKEFVQSSVRVAVEAAAKVSELLNAASSQRLMAPFAGYCAFLSSTVHVWGIFSKNARLEAASKRNLATNVKYLSQMKKVWGVLYHMSDNLKTIYREFADTPSAGSRTASSEAQKGSADNKVLEYGAWFDAYPHGVSQSDYQEPAPSVARASSDDAALSQKSDLQTVEEFFESPTPPAPVQRKVRKGGGAASALSSQRKSSQRQSQSTSQKSPQPPSSFPAPLRPEATWSPSSLPMQSVYANMPNSAFAIPGHPPSQSQRQQGQQQQPQMRRTSHGHMPQGISLPRQRSSFDPTSAPQQNPRVNTDLEAFPGGVGMRGGSTNTPSGIPMYSPPPFPSPSPQSGTMPSFSNTAFFSATTPHNVPLSNMSMTDIDRRMVYGAYATDPGVQPGLWDAGVDFSGMDMNMGAAAASLGDLASSTPGAGGDNAGMEFDAEAASAAWFMPFNIDVGADAFSGAGGGGTGTGGDGFGFGSGKGDGESSI